MGGADPALFITEKEITVQKMPQITRVPEVASHPDSWTPFIVGDIVAGEVHSLAFGGAGTLLESAALWRHGGGELPYARPVSSELFYVIQGSAHISDSEGVVLEIRAGDTVQVPVGFVGTWTTHEPILKMSVSAIIPDLG